MSNLDPKMEEERNAVIAYLRRYSKEERRHANALLADAGTWLEAHK